MQSQLAKASEAQACEARIKEYLMVADSFWLRGGREVSRMHDEKLYLELGFKTFDKWAEDRFPKVSRSTIRRWMDCYNKHHLAKGLTDEQLQGVPERNAWELLKAPKEKMPLFLETAKTQTHDRLLEEMEFQLGPLHVGEKSLFAVWMTLDQKRKMEFQLNLAMQELGTESRAEALEGILADYDGLDRKHVKEILSIAWQVAELRPHLQKYFDHYGT